MMLQLLVEVIHSWEELFTVEEIWHSQEKLQLLLDSHEHLDNKVVVPDEVRDYYIRVFGRNMWG